MIDIVQDIKVLMPNIQYSDAELERMIDIVFDELQAEIKPFKSAFKITLYKDIDKYDLNEIVEAQVNLVNENLHLLEITHIEDTMQLGAKLVNNVIVQVIPKNDGDYIIAFANLVFDNFNAIPNNDKFKLRHAIIYGVTSKIAESLGQQDQEQYANLLYQRFYNAKKKLINSEPQFLDFSVKIDGWQFSSNEIPFDGRLRYVEFD